MKIRESIISDSIQTRFLHSHSSFLAWFCLHCAACDLLTTEQRDMVKSSSYGCINTEVSPSSLSLLSDNVDWVSGYLVLLTLVGDWS